MYQNEVSMQNVVLHSAYNTVHIYSTRGCGWTITVSEYQKRGAILGADQMLFLIFRNTLSIG